MARAVDKIMRACRDAAVLAWATGQVDDFGATQDEAIGAYARSKHLLNERGEAQVAGAIACEFFDGNLDAVREAATYVEEDD